MGYYAEFGTDKYIIEKYFPNKLQGTMIEVGAGLPEIISTSRAFKELGWRCICVDPNPYYVQKHKEIGNEIYEYALSNKVADDAEFNIIKMSSDPNDGLSYSCLKEKPLRRTPNSPFSETIQVKVTTLNKLLEKIEVSKIDFISIDTEGWEIEVMQGFNVQKYNPSVILLENLDHDIMYHTYMNIIGYKLDHILQQNEIYIKNNQS